MDITRLKEITQRSEQHKLYLCLVSWSVHGDCSTYCLLRLFHANDLHLHHCETGIIPNKGFFSQNLLYWMEPLPDWLGLPAELREPWDFWGSSFTPAAIQVIKKDQFFSPSQGGRKPQTAFLCPFSTGVLNQGAPFCLWGVSGDFVAGCGTKSYVKPRFICSCHFDGRPLSFILM